MRVAPQIILTDRDRSQLEVLASANHIPAKVAQRARIVLLAAQREQNKVIAARLGIGRAQVARWRERFVQDGLEAILQEATGMAGPVRAYVAQPATRNGEADADALWTWSDQVAATEPGGSPLGDRRHWRPQEVAGGVSGSGDAPLVVATGETAQPAMVGAETARPMLPIASSKVMPPRGARRLMLREALMERLREARRRRCVIIQGQAGSGKTSALMAWRKEMFSLGYDVCWLSLSVDENEPSSFFDSLLASVAEVDPAVASEAAKVLVGQCDQTVMELGIITLVQALAHRQRELILMVDDLHHIADVRILQSIQWLLEYAPPQFHMAMTSRTALELPLEHLRLQGMLEEFDMRDLRFSLEESARFLRDQLGAIDSGDAAALHALSDGWAAGLQLLAIGMRTGQRGKYPATQVRDAHAFANFFEREVLLHLAPDDLDMLTRVSICQRFCAPLCAAIMGRLEAVPHIRARVSQMVADHLFITVAGGRDHETWYRIHPLLRETLLGHLAARGAAEQAASHAAAWRWFEAHGHIDDAVRHAVSAGKTDAAATLVESCAQALLVRGELNQAASLLRMLPAAEVRRRFGLQVVMAFLQFYARDFDALRDSLAEMEAGSATQDACGRYTVCLLRAGIALQLDDIDAAAAMLPAVRDVPAEADDFTWHARGNALSWMLTLRGEHDLARLLLEEVTLRTRSPRSRLLGHCIHALSLAREGRIKQAGKIAREVMEEADGHGPGYVGLASMAAGLLADTLYELNETEAACQLLEPRFGMLERGALPEVMLRACLVLSGGHWLAGRRQQALAVLDRLEAYALRYGLNRLLAEARVQRLRRHLQQGEMQQAGVVLEYVQALAGRRPDSGPEQARQNAWAAARATIDMALYTRDFAGALEGIQSLIASIIAPGSQVQDAACLYMQCAIARLGNGQRAAARQDFVEAIRVGHRLGLSRTLLDAIDIVPGALDALDVLHVDASGPLASPVLDFYVQRLRFAHGSAMRQHRAQHAALSASPMTSLSQREREILDLLALAMSNKKIAKILNVSAETVKWHLRNVYRKLGVGGRGGAAELSRDLARPA